MFVQINNVLVVVVFQPKGDVSNQTLLAGIPLAVMDAAICWWISFVSSLTGKIESKLKMTDSFHIILMID